MGKVYLIILAYSDGKTSGVSYQTQYATSQYKALQQALEEESIKGKKVGLVSIKRVSMRLAKEISKHNESINGDRDE